MTNTIKHKSLLQMQIDQKQSEAIQLQRTVQDINDHMEQNSLFHSPEWLNKRLDAIDDFKEVYEQYLVLVEMKQERDLM